MASLLDRVLQLFETSADRAVDDGVADGGHDAAEDRLKAALTNATGKQVNLKVIVDSSVLGGIVATVGDTVIDGSVRRRLEQLRNAL